MRNLTQKSTALRLARFGNLLALMGALTACQTMQAMMETPEKEKKAEVIPPAVEPIPVRSARASMIAPYRRDPRDHHGHWLCGGQHPKPQDTSAKAVARHPRLETGRLSRHDRAGLWSTLGCHHHRRRHDRDERYVPYPR